MKTGRSTGNDAARPPRGFAALARRVSALTSRAVLSAVVVIAGIAFARQVLQWWRDDAADLQPPPAATPGLGHPRAVHEVTVGARPWSIVQQTFQGDAVAASGALLAACQSAAGETDGMHLPPPGPEERDLLARLAGSEPDRQTPEGIALYALPDGFPMVVGTRDVGSGAPAVATWGIAVPTAPTSWSLYTFRPRDDGFAREPPADGAAPAPPLPPGCRRLLQVRAVGGDTSIVFAGPSRPDEWKVFYDRWAANAGLQDQGGWRESGGAWHVTYVGTEPNRAGVVEVHFDQGRGLILVAP